MGGRRVLFEWMGSWARLAEIAELSHRTFLVRDTRLRRDAAAEERVTTNLSDATIGIVRATVALTAAATASEAEAPRNDKHCEWEKMTSSESPDTGEEKRHVTPVRGSSAKT